MLRIGHHAFRDRELYEEYAKYPEITRKRLYYEMIREVFPGIKVILQGADGSMQTVLPLDDFTGGKGAD